MPFASRIFHVFDPVNATPVAPPSEPKPKKPNGGGPNPWLVAAGALVAGIALAKWIDWRGHAHPRD